MAFFKRIQKKVNNMWYPQSVTWGKKKTASAGNGGSTSDDSGSGSTGGDGNSSENPLG